MRFLEVSEETETTVEDMLRWVYDCVAKQGKQKAVFRGILGGTGEVVLAGDGKCLLFQFLRKASSIFTRCFSRTQISIFGYLRDLRFLTYYSIGCRVLYAAVKQDR
jgi:hypothetical protein